MDDDAMVLAGITRTLRHDFVVRTASSASEALGLLEGEPFAVIIADLHMPGTDGIELLARVHSRWSETVRILLTGTADVDAALEAVNQGRIFRFLCKPTGPVVLLGTVKAAVTHHASILVERQLLQQTVRGSVDALVEMLSLVDPVAFSRARRIAALVGRLADLLDAPRRWEIDVAALVSQLGVIAIPAATARKLHHGEALSDEDQRVVGQLPGIADELVAHIPRLDGVRRIVRHQNDDWDPASRRAIRGTAIPLGARLLRVAIDADMLSATGMPAVQLIQLLRQRSRSYDPDVLAALEVAYLAHIPTTYRVSLADLEVGMVLGEDLCVPNGPVLMGRGQTITSPVLARLRILELDRALPERVDVMKPPVPMEAAAAASYTEQAPDPVG